MIDFAEVLAANSARFREVLAAVPAASPVPSCPKWTAGDLLWRLTEVQSFWGTVVDQRLLADEQVGAVPPPERPMDHGSASALFEKVSTHLVEVRSIHSNRSWMVRLGRFRGVAPSGQGHEEPDHQPVVQPDGSADAVLEGPAADLMLWLWGRTSGAEANVTGDQGARAALREAIVANTQ